MGQWQNHPARAGWLARLSKRQMTDTGFRLALDRGLTGGVLSAEIIRH